MIDVDGTKPYGEFAAVLDQILARAPDLAGQLAKEVTRSVYWIKMLARGGTIPPTLDVIDRWVHADLLSEEDRDRLVAAIPVVRAGGTMPPAKVADPFFGVDKGGKDLTAAWASSMGPVDVPALSPAEVVAKIRENLPPVDLSELVTPDLFRPPGRGGVMSLKPEPARYDVFETQRDRYRDLSAPVRMTLRRPMSTAQLTAMQGGPVDLPAPRFDSIMGPILTESPPCEPFTPPKRGRGAAARASRHADLADRLDAFAMGHCDDGEAALFCEAAAALRGAP